MTTFPPKWLIPAVKALTPYVILHYWFMYDPSWLYSNGRAWVYAIIALILLNAGQTIGGFWDTLVMAVTGLALGLGLGSIIICIFESQLLSYEAAMALALIVMFMGVVWFGYLRTFGPRYFAIILNTLLFTSTAVVCAGIGGTSNVSYAGITQPAVGFLFGVLVCAIFNWLVFPKTAHNVCRRFLIDWLHVIRKSMSSVLRAYTSDLNHAAEAVDLDELKRSLSGMIRMADGILNQVQSEPCFFSQTPSPVLVDLAQDFRSLTDVIFAIVGGLRLYQDWISQENCKKPIREILEPFAQRIENELNGFMDTIETCLVASTQSNLFGGTGPSQSKKRLCGIEKLVCAITDFEHQQRLLLGQMQESHISCVKEHCPENMRSIAKHSDNVVSFYAFNILLEEFANRVVTLERKLKATCVRRVMVYIPFTKWLPYWFFSLPRRLFSKEHFYDDEQPSFKKPLNHIWKFMKSMDVVFAFKMSACFLLFMTMYLHPSTRSFFMTYGLAGTIVDLSILVSPTFGQSFLTAWVQVVGYILGSTASLITFYACGLTTEALWVPITVFAFLGFYVHQNIPEREGFAFLYLIAFAVTNFSCFSSLKAGVSTPLHIIFAKTILTCLFGLVFGIVFTLFLFPRFATTELNKLTAHILNHVQDLYRGIDSAPREAAQKIASLLKQRKANVLNESEYEKALTQVAQESEDRLSSLRALATKTLSELLRLPELIEFSTKEPSLENAFPRESWEALVASMETVVSRLRGALIAMKRPWYMQPHLVQILSETAMAHAQLAKTIHILYYLYEGAVTLQNPLPEELPDAVQVRDDVLEQVTNALLSMNDKTEDMLPPRVCRMIKQNIERKNEHIVVMIEQSADEQSLRNLWNKYRKQHLRSKKNSKETKGTNSEGEEKVGHDPTDSRSTLHDEQEETIHAESETTEASSDASSESSADLTYDIFYYAYLLSMRGAVSETDLIGAKLQKLFGI